MAEFGKQNTVSSGRLVKYYWYLIVIRLAAAALSLLSMVPYVGGYAETVSFLPDLALIVVLWQLGNGTGRYWMASVLLCVSMGINFVVWLTSYINAVGELVWLFNDAAPFVTLAASLCSFVALYQEYNAHAEAIEPLDKAVARKWHSLFNWQIVFLLVSYVLSFVLIAVFFMFPVIMEIYAVIIEVVNLVIAWFYIRYLNEMRKRLQNVE